MATQPPTITPAPNPPPQRGDRTTFSSRVDAFLMWMAAAVAQFQQVATNVYDNAVGAFQSAASALLSAQVAAAQAQAAQAVSGVLVFNPAKAYAAGEAAYSLVNGQTYRRITAGTSATNPANDQTNWRLLSGNDSNGAFLPIAITGTVIDLSLGNYFTTTKSANTAFTFTNIPAGGYSWTLELTLTASVMTTFPTSVKTPNNSSSGLQANKTHELMFVTSNGGTRVRLVTAPNFDT